MRRLRLLSACLVGCAILFSASGVGAQSLVNAPAYRAAGSPQQAIGVFPLKLDGTADGFAPPASSGVSVQRTTGIGQTGVLVSASDTVNRRTVTNTSSLACELMGSAAAYGTGYPLPAGQSFTFDASGRTTAALYVACASAGGTIAVISY